MLGAIFALVLALPLVSVGASPTKHPPEQFIIEDISFTESFFDCGFEIVQTNTGWVKVTEELDATGDFLGALVRVQYHGSFMNPETGKTYRYVSGRVEKVSAETGRIVFAYTYNNDFFIEEVVFEAGIHTDDAFFESGGLCDLLAPDA